MRNLIDYINESRNKDEYYKVKTTTDKYYVALRQAYNGYFSLTPEKMTEMGWWAPNDRNYDPKVISEQPWGVCISLNRAIGNPPKNPITGKNMGIRVDDRNDTIKYGANLETAMLYRGEDPSESLAAIINLYIEKYLSKVPSTRKDYKTILKDVRKMLLKAYNDMQEPMTPAEREAMRAHLTDLTNPRGAGLGVRAY